jgi:hypothetical protein
MKAWLFPIGRLFGKLDLVDEDSKVRTERLLYVIALTWQS